MSTQSIPRVAALETPAASLGGRTKSQGTWQMLSICTPKTEHGLLLKTGIRETERDGEGLRSNGRDSERDLEYRGNSVYMSLLVYMDYSLKTLFTSFPLIVCLCSMKGMGMLH